MHAADVYDYAIVRVVPRVEREEFINAGVILSCQRTGFLQAAMALDEPRLRALDPDTDVETVRRHLSAIVAICAGDAGCGPIAALPYRARFHWLTARRSAIIQTSAVHTGRCTDAAAALDHIMERMVRPRRPPPAARDAG
ncbi:DUF3037 domain-containing protein [Acidovorax sp. GBBC 3334]|uniref:DUF3037 domain-containing protein n=1 Tax=Acidovorax sp. GBBC 3334 TaxID=2940496 RepID=UPI0023032289|nr:DUF3037 domain-containing protein [Acidovorax sp. GBBC 3334]MDA8454214.1 DUF3037 domain-containing protein [Acidovorax sp. GBBC 3334]